LAGSDPGTGASQETAVPIVTPPYHPIIYVRGYAMTAGEVAATVATPYMGFNLGSTKVRQNWQGGVVRHVFESPLVRLMKDYDYRDIYMDGVEQPGTLPARSVVIYRYYEEGDPDLGSGKVPSIEDAAAGLRDLVLKVRDQVCGDDADARKAFRVYLVGHSMGGLVCRSFLQKIATAAERKMIDKVFTYASPHNGIEMAGINVPGFFGIWDLSNFNRKRMAGYFGLQGSPKRVDTLDGTFDPERFFCLIGTNHKDYDAGGGFSRRLAGEMSDGLVKIENAAVSGAPRAFVYRSHSGPYGIVNSEEGYQNLVRFLFGDTRIDGLVEVEALPLPPSVQKAKDEGKKIKASYYFESTVSPRGSFTFKLTERRVETFSAVLRGFDEMMQPRGGDAPRWPVLFSTFLDRKKITVGQTIVFSVDLAVSTTGYEIDGFLFLDRHVPGEYLFRNTVTVRATPRDDGWSIRYNMTDDRWSEQTGTAAKEDDDGWYIPLTSAKGFEGKLRLAPRAWNTD
jgi:hypothetical protein